MADNVVEKGLDKLRSFRLPSKDGVPVGAAVVFSLATAASVLAGAGVQKLPVVGNLLKKAPILPAAAIAYLFTIKPVKNLIGERTADIGALAAFVGGIELQTQLSSRVVNFANNKLGGSSTTVAVLPSNGGGAAAISAPNPLLKGLSKVEQAFVVNT